MMVQYDLEKIRFATDTETLQRAIDLYEKNKVKNFKKDSGGFSAVVQGTQLYHVAVSAKDYDRGDCTCYLGQNDTLCKHMVAVAIYAVMNGKQLSQEDMIMKEKPLYSGRLGVLRREEFAVVKKSITGALKYIKAYDGPSRTWFAYQDSLQEGCRRLSAIVSELPVDIQTARLLVQVLVRLDKKLLQGGVDDSDGTVGSFMQELVEALTQYATLEPACIQAFEVLRGQETCFGWEESLLTL